ncbi:hypothetical protein WG78_15325 [Amantichitinum ursilacus]|uniref:Uncharacterized protein n=1 Tax=Amantichitinum ursilacus TaxID=857265 RepID=A0A0N0GMU6_9NEIS|nr:hypothetical protein WG78_15325 [Amantichitinum ursilacus]
MAAMAGGAVSVYGCRRGTTANVEAKAAHFHCRHRLLTVEVVVVVVVAVALADVDEVSEVVR